MVPRGVAGYRLALLVAAAAEVIVVAAIAVSRHESALSTLAALVLAPFAILAASGLAAQVAGRRLGLLAALAYVALPLLGRLYMYGSFVTVYDHKIAPAVVGLEHTGWFVVGIAVALLLALAPQRAAGIAGVVGAAIALILCYDAPWHRLWDNFHETTWSQTFLAFLPVAALVGAARKSPWLAAGLGGWLAFVVLRGLDRDYGTGGFWVSVAGAAPAIAVLLSSLAYLVPRLRAAPQPDPAR